MVGVLVALRLRLLGAAAGSPARVLGAVASAFLIGALSALATFAAVISGLAPDPGGTVVAAAAAAIWLGWILVPVLGPVLGVGLDASLAPGALALLPVRGRELVPGLLVAGLLGPVPAATALVALGLAASHVRSPGGALVAALAVVVLLCLCVGSSRAAVTALARRATTRRRRDAALVAAAIALAAAGLTGIPLLLAHAGAGNAVAGGLGWTPGGQVGLALWDARLGRLGPAWAHLAAASVVLLLVLPAWARSLDRAFVTTPGEGGRPGRSALRRLARWLPARDRRTTAVAAKEILLGFRDPVRRSTWIVAWSVGVGCPLFLTVGQGRSLGEAETLLTAVPALIAAGGINLNGFGLDGTAIWAQISSSASLEADLRGRALGVLTMNLPGTVLAALLFAAAGGHPWSAPLGVGAGAGVLLAVLGAGAILSVRTPLARARSPFGVSPGLSGRNLLVSAAGVLASVLALAPGALLVAVGLSSRWPPGLFAGTGALVACGAAVCLAGMSAAARWVDPRQPELLEAVSPPHA